MTRIHSIPATEIEIPRERQRKEFNPEYIQQLAGSIDANGLINPVVVRKGIDGQYILVAGECRIRAMHIMWSMGLDVRHGTSRFIEGHAPCTLFTDLDELAAQEIEFEENARRRDLTWQERASAEAKLLALRRARATAEGKTEAALPTHTDIAKEVYGPSTASANNVRRDIAVAAHLDDPEIAKASTAQDAFKILKRREELAKSAELARSVGATFSSALHDMRLGDCLEVMVELPPFTFDVILTDPPYGIDADQFGDSGGGRSKGSHFYDDSWTEWNRLLTKCAPLWFGLAKPQAHLYMFCDIDNFVMAKQLMIEAGWWVHRTPLTWVNPRSQRIPWPQHGPQRKTQWILYGVKGKRPVLKILSDLLVYPTDENLNHQAQKPIALLADLLSRSVRAGDTVLDSFGGTGSTMVAAHEVKCRATIIERDEAAYGIAAARLKELK